MGAALLCLAPVAFMSRGGLGVLRAPLFALALVAFLVAALTHLASLRLASARWPALAFTALGALAWTGGFVSASATPCP